MKSKKHKKQKCSGTEWKVVIVFQNQSTSLQIHFSFLMTSSVFSTAKVKIKE